MHKQQALALLRERMKEIPSSDTDRMVVLNQFIEGLPHIDYASFAEAEAVRELARRGALYDLTSNATNLAPAGFRTFYWEFDGDMELLASVPADRAERWCFGDNTYCKIQLRRRPARYAEFVPRLPIALRIPSKHRDLLPSTAGIVAAEADFAIIVPMEFFTSTNRIPYLHQESEEKMYFGIRDLQRYFKAEWVEDTQIVYRIPPIKENNISRTGETLSFHSVQVTNPTAGYADQILEIVLYERRGGKDEWVICWHSPPSGGSAAQSKIRKELYIKGIDDAAALFLAGFCEIHEKVKAAGYSQSE